MNKEFQQILDYLYGLLPMYQRTGSLAIKKDLDNTLALCRHLGNPHKKFKSIHVAGTNGKGSSSHMLASVLQEAGYHTGLYTSPHLKSFTERIKIDGVCIPEEFVIQFVNGLKPVIEQIMPSFFELTVVMAFDYFARREVDIAVVEVGLGGRLDSTNVVNPEISLITNIGLDHAEMLGDTLEKIAFEKAGIIKKDVPVVVSEYQEEVAPVFEDIAKKKKTRLHIANKSLHTTNVKNEGLRLVFDVAEGKKTRFTRLVSDLPGTYQLKNIPGVIKTLDLLPSGEFVISESALRKGLASVKNNTGLKGRWQTLGQNPLVICDTGHNEDGIKEVAKCISATKYNKLFIIFGMVKDKDPKKLLIHLPKEAKYYFCEPDIPRKLPADSLNDIAREADRSGIVIEDVNAALKTALQEAGENDLIFIGGSNFVVAELENL